MPLIRRPTNPSPLQIPDPREVLKSLSDPDPDQRWAAARDAPMVEDGGVALAAALRTEVDSRVREAMFSGLARVGSPAAVEAVISLLRSDDANLRTGALDALRVMTVRVPELVPRLLGDQDIDVRILSCELARCHANAAATTMLCELLAVEAEVNVCAAAVDVLAEVGSAAALPVLRECERRFRDSAFLAFAIKVVIDRLTAQSASPRA